MREYEIGDKYTRKTVGGKTASRLYSFAPELLTAQGIRDRLRQLVPGTWLMAIVAWLTVFTGTYIVYPWYRAVPPQGAADLTLFPSR